MSGIKAAAARPAADVAVRVAAGVAGVAVAARASPVAADAPT